METVCCGKQWDVILLRDGHGTITAALPYLIGSKLGLRYILQPQLTQYNGPWFRPGTNVPAATQQLIQELRKLPLTFYRQSFAPATPNIEAWQGYEKQARVTYRIEDCTAIGNSSSVSVGGAGSRIDHVVRGSLAFTNCLFA